MSLKSFHLLFIALSAVMAFGLCAWAIDAYAARDGGSTLLLAACALLLGGGLVVYGLRVRAKLHKLEAP